MLNSVERKKLELDEKRYQLELDKHKRDSRFLNRHLALLISSLISIITIIVSSTQIYITEVNKEKSIELAKIQKSKELEVTRENNMMKWRLDLASFVAKNKDLVFSSSSKDRVKIRDVMILTFPTDIVEAVFRDLSETVPRSDKETWNEGIEIIQKRKPEYIVIHSVSMEIRNVDVDLIDKWHKDRGWSEIGHHYLITDDKHDMYPDGDIQEGRTLEKPGAHTRGLNNRSIGIVLAGHGDKVDFTDKQKESLHNLILSLLERYPEITVDNVIGHNEVIHLVDEGLLDEKYRYFKKCPGQKVNMEEIRRKLTLALLKK